MKPFRAITGANDWTFGQGVNGYFTRDRAIAADVKTALLFFLNDCFFAMDTGIDWWNLLGSKTAQAKANILLQTRQTIVSREGIVRINSVDATIDSARRRIRITYNIDTIYSRSVTGSVQTA